MDRVEPVNFIDDVTRPLETKLLDAAREDDAPVVTALKKIHERFEDFPESFDEKSYTQYLLECVSESKLHLRLAELVDRRCDSQNNFFNGKIEPQDIDILTNTYAALPLISNVKDIVEELEETNIESLTLTLMIQPISDKLFNQCLHFLPSLLNTTSRQPMKHPLDNVVTRCLDVLMQVRAHAQEFGASDYNTEWQVRILIFLSHTPRNLKCRSKLRDKLGYVACAILCQCNDELNSADVIESTLKVIKGVTANLFNKFELVDSGYLPCIVKYTTHTNAGVRKVAIEIVSSITGHTDDIILTMMRSSLFNHVAVLLMSNEETVYQVAWMVSTVAAGTDKLRNSLPDYHLWPMISVLLMWSSNQNIVSEILWLILNFLGCAGKEEKLTCLQNDRYGVISAVLCQLSSETNHVDNMSLALSIVENLLGLLSDLLQQSSTVDVSAIVALIAQEFSKAHYTQMDEGNKYYSEMQELLSTFEEIQRIGHDSN